MLQKIVERSDENTFLHRSTYFSWGEDTKILYNALSIGFAQLYNIIVACLLASKVWKISTETRSFFHPLQSTMPDETFSNIF